MSGECGAGPRGGLGNRSCREVYFVKCQRLLRLTSHRRSSGGQIARRITLEAQAVRARSKLGRLGKRVLTAERFLFLYSNLCDALSPSLAFASLRGGAAVRSLLEHSRHRRTYCWQCPRR
jgi:hypothetical protein